MQNENLEKQIETVLELVKQGLIDVKQNDRFEISISKVKMWECQVIN
jgi:hypothetical protein